MTTLPIYIYDLSKKSIDKFFESWFSFIAEHEGKPFPKTHIAEFFVKDQNKVIDAILSDKRYRILCQMWCRNSDLSPSRTLGLELDDYRGLTTILDYTERKK